MSFAEVAAKAGEKVDKTQIEIDHEAKVAQVEEQANKAKGKIAEGEAKAQSVLDDLKKDVPKLGEEGKILASDAIDNAKKDLKQGKNALHKLFENIVSGISSASAYIVDTTKTSTVKAKEELKNPVVATQTVVTIGAVAGLFFGIQERAKIFKNRTDLEISAILAGLLGFVVLDGYLFATNYDKYSKKSLK